MVRILKVVYRVLPSKVLEGLNEVNTYMSVWHALNAQVVIIVKMWLLCNLYLPVTAVTRFV